MFLDIILDKVEEVTGIEPKVAGGNFNYPLLYRLYQINDMLYRLEFIYSGRDISDILQMINSVDEAIVDFYDIPKLGVASITKNGGGMSNVNNKIDYLSIYDVVPKETAEPLIIPAGFTTLTVNGTYDIAQYAEVVVATEAYPEPTGTLDITSNGQYDVKDVEFADVNVPNPSTGTLDITSNGVYDVSLKASVNVDVPYHPCPLKKPYTNLITSIDENAGAYVDGGELLDACTSLVKIIFTGNGWRKLSYIVPAEKMIVGHRYEIGFFFYTQKFDGNLERMIGIHQSGGSGFATAYEQMVRAVVPTEAYTQNDHFDYIFTNQENQSLEFRMLDNHWTSIGQAGFFYVGNIYCYDLNEFD